MSPTVKQAFLALSGSARAALVQASFAWAKAYVNSTRAWSCHARFSELR